MKTVIKSQYLATLAMLRQTIEKCPDNLWDAANQTNRFWHVAYHALFYTHLYLQISGDAFTPWEKHSGNLEILGATPWPPHTKPEIGEPFTKNEILDYLELCTNEVVVQTDKLVFDDPSGFEWLPFNKFELQLYNIRHLQHHVGELSDQLFTQAQIEVDWVGMQHA